MRCSTAQDLYFASRDGTIDERGRMRLAEHLSRCASCALFVKEMELSLEAVKGLPELATSEGFEWNVKRRILQERTRLMRREGMVRLGERSWLSRFAVGAVASAAVVVLAATILVQRWGPPVPSVKEVAQEQRAPEATVPVSSLGGGTVVDVLAASGTAGPRLVSDNPLGFGRGSEILRQGPLQLMSGSREDSLARENVVLKKRIESLEREIALLKGMLDKERARTSTAPVR